jgi:dolichol kinase
MKDLQINLVVMVVCYIYIAGVIIMVSILKQEGLNPKKSRKLLHLLIGGLPLIMPFFTRRIFPFLVASPFVILTFLVTPSSPLTRYTKKLSILSELTEEGHHMGLVLYSLSYTILAYFFGTRPYILAMGIFPMAFGDSSAAIIGTQYGKNMIGDKSLEGSLGMFIGSLFSILVGMVYFKSFYQFNIIDQIISILAVSFVVAIVELVSPRGSDNLTVPFMGVITYLLIAGGF